MTTRLINNVFYAKTEISVEAVARYFGGNRYLADKQTAQRILRCIDTALELVAPRAAYSVFQVMELVPGKRAVLEKNQRVILPECFDDPGTEFLCAAIGTLGHELEMYCRALAGDGKIYESTLFDAVGTVMLDLLSDKISAAILHSGGKDGLSRGARFSPGIDGYPLEQQQQLFTLVESRSVKVRLHSSAVMEPAKSISFFMVLTNTPQKHTAQSKCSLCRLASCQFRKVPHYE